MTSQIDIDCRHYYGDRELGIARPVDINDHQENTERHRQRGRSPDHRNSPTTETSLILMTKATEPRERTIDKFYNSLLSLGIEPPYHGVVAIVANH